jgi:hypothetical protein
MFWQDDGSSRFKEGIQGIGESQSIGDFSLALRETISEPSKTRNF